MTGRWRVNRLARGFPDEVGQAPANRTNGHFLFGAER
jgi:hypothetical protein